MLFPNRTSTVLTEGLRIFLFYATFFDPLGICSDPIIVQIDKQPAKRDLVGRLSSQRNQQQTPTADGIH